LKDKLELLLCSHRCQPLQGNEYYDGRIEQRIPVTDENRALVGQIFQDAEFVRSLGVELVSFGKGWCETKVNVSPVLQQQHGFIHAGVLMTIADHTCGGAAASTVPADKDVITVENKISFLRPASGSVLFCRAEVLRAGQSLIFVEAEVTAERKDGRALVAKASSTLAVIPRKREISRSCGRE
jgi:uncharacterized protein (TIGR00369 family)